MNRIVSKNSPEYQALKHPQPVPRAGGGESVPPSVSRPGTVVVRAPGSGRKHSRTEADPRTKKERAEARRKRLLGIGAAALLAAALCAGNFFLADVRSDWYGELAKPAFCPPLWALFAAYAAGVLLMCACYALVLTRSTGLLLRFEYLFNALLQLLWTVFFFRLRAVFAALIVLVLLVLHTFFLLKYTRRAIGKIGYLLLGHLLRVLFCILLNYSILVVN